MSNYTRSSDAELVALLHEGDYEAFTEIYERYWNMLLRHAIRMTRDPEGSQDIVQDVFAMLWLKGRKIRLKYTLSSFLYTATRFKVLNRIGHLKVREQYIASLHAFRELGPGAADALLLGKETAARIEAELGRLPVKMREVFVLSRVYEYSYREISELLKITDNTVKKQISNALRILRMKLQTLFFFSA